MAGKTKEKSTARFMYVEQGKEGKEIASLLNVSENTISKWVNDNGWKAEREARLNSFTQRAENIKKVISNLCEQQLEYQELRKQAIKTGNKAEISILDVQSVNIADQISKWNKALSSLDKQNRITLDIYLEVMDDVFKSLQGYDHALYMKSLDFQEQHIQFISSKLG